MTIDTDTRDTGRSSGQVPLIGCSTAGEIATRTHGISGFHNQTLVVLAVM